MLKAMRNGFEVVKGAVVRAKNVVAALAVAVVTVVVSNSAVAAGLDIIAKDATGGVVFKPESLAQPIIDAVIDTAKYGALIALVFIGLYIIIKMFKGK